jgi:hypothetical protein
VASYSVITICFAYKHRCNTEAVRTKRFYFTPSLPVERLAARLLAVLIKDINRMFFSSNWKLMKLAII